MEENKKEKEVVLKQGLLASPMVSHMIETYTVICENELTYADVCITSKITHAEAKASLVKLKKITKLHGKYDNSAISQMLLPPIRAKKFTIMDPSTSAFDHMDSVTTVPGFNKEWFHICRYGRTGFVFSEPSSSDGKESLGVARAYTDGSRFVKKDDTVLIAASRIYGSTKKDATDKLFSRFPLIVSKRGGDSFFVLNKKSLSLFKNYKVITSPSLIREGYDAYVQVESGPEEQENNYLVN